MSSTYGTSKTVTIPSDGDTIDAVDVNVPISAMWDEHDVLADITALRAILVPTHGLIRYVRGYGHYVFVTSGTYSATTADSPWILTATDGTPGRWVYDGYAVLGETFTTYRSVVRPPPFITAGSEVAGDTGNKAVVALTPTYAYDAQFLNVNAAAAEGKIMYFPLIGLGNEETITAATVYVTPFGGHGGLPALMPGICVVRRRHTTGAISSLQSGGFVLDSSASVVAYEAMHAITTGAAIDQNNETKIQEYDYLLLVQNEGHTNAVAGLIVGSAYITVTTRRYQR